MMICVTLAVIGGLAIIATVICVSQAIIAHFSDER